MSTLGELEKLFSGDGQPIATVSGATTRRRGTRKRSTLSSVTFKNAGTNRPPKPRQIRPMPPTFTHPVHPRLVNAGQSKPTPDAPHVLRLDMQEVGGSSPSPPTTFHSTDRPPSQWNRSRLGHGTGPISQKISQRLFPV